MEKFNFTWRNPKSSYMFRASQIPLTNTLILYGNLEEIKKKKEISDFKNGGLRMPHVETLIKIQKNYVHEKILREL